MRYYKKTSTIKKVFTGVLASVSSLGMLLGFNFINKTKIDEPKKEKAEVIKEYQLTEEYQNAKLDKEEEIMEDFMTGEITFQEKEEKVKALNTYSATETMIEESSNQEFKERLKEANEGILKEGKEILKGVLTLVASSVLSISLYYKFAGMSNEFKYDELENDEELSQRPVIV